MAAVSHCNLCRISFDPASVGLHMKLKNTSSLLHCCILSGVVRCNKLLTPGPHRELTALKKSFVYLSGVHGYASEQHHFLAAHKYFLCSFGVFLFNKNITWLLEAKDAMQRTSFAVIRHRSQKSSLQLLLQLAVPFLSPTTLAPIPKVGLQAARGAEGGPVSEFTVAGCHFFLPNIQRHVY